MERRRDGRVTEKRARKFEKISSLSEAPCRAVPYEELKVIAPKDKLRNALASEPPWGTTSNYKR